MTTNPLTLALIAYNHGINVADADADAWRESFDDGTDPWATLCNASRSVISRDAYV